MFTYVARLRVFLKSGCVFGISRHLSDYKKKARAAENIIFVTCDYYIHQLSPSFLYVNL